jgi:Domain of unknown function (DUF4350)
MSPVWKAVLGIGAALVAVNLALGEIEDATRGPQGPASSSFATTPSGAAAYAALLERFDHPVLRLREELDEARLDPGATVVLLDPGSLAAEELTALGDFVRAGGRLVASGSATGTLAGDLDVLPTGQVYVADNAGVLAFVERVRTAGEAAWDGVTQARVLLGPRRAPFLLEQRIGAGRALLLADSSPLQNRLLAGADNASLGLQLAGPPQRPVVFVESVHGYAEATGVAAIPARWWWVLGGLALAAVLYALASGRRFGPPEREQRELAPPRGEFADAVATGLAKARPRRAAVATVRRVARARLTRAARLPADADDEAVGRAAAELGIDAAAVAAVLGPGADDAALLALGRLLTDLERKEMRA